MGTKGLSLLLSVILALTLACVILLDPTGWGAFVLDLAVSFVVQSSVALLLFSILLMALTVFKHFPILALSQRVSLAIFFATAVLALLPLPILFHRQMDFYDGIQTAVLLVAFNFVIGPFLRFWERAGFRLRKQLLIIRPVVGFTRSTSYVDPELYQNLLKKVSGDKRTAERLIEYERRLEPNATRRELVRRAVERWERDNR